MKTGRKIIFIGSGNVATHLAIALSKAGNNIVQIFSQTLEHAQSLAKKTQATYIDDIEKISCDADLYIFSVKDDALPEILAKMPKTTGVWVHTAGSVPMDIFKTHTDDYGVMYPLQTFSKNRDVNFSAIPVFIEGSDAKTAHFLEVLAKSVLENVQYLSSEKRKYLHLAAVFACNFTNHLYALSAEILEKESISFDVLKPLIFETVAKITEMKPKEAQTGPALRFDKTIMKKHLTLLEDEQIKNMYSLLSESIYRRRE